MRAFAVVAVVVARLRLLQRQSPPIRVMTPRRRVMQKDDENIDRLTGEEIVIDEVFQLQYVSVNLQSGRPRSPFNAGADKCLRSLAPDEMGGAGLGFGHCAHYGKTDNRGRPRQSMEKPSNETLFYFFKDGRVRNIRTGWCIRRTKCSGQHVYDLGGCDSPLVSKFNLWKARANRADLREFVGLPPIGVEGPCTQCGPYLLKQVCGEEGTSCGHSDHAGWTRHQVHIVPHATGDSYTIAFSPSPFSVCGTRVQQTGEGIAVGEPDPVPPWYYFHRYSPDGTLKKREPPKSKPATALAKKSPATESPQQVAAADPASSAPETAVSGGSPATPKPA